MIQPVNGHVLIEPLLHGSFIASQKETYEEIGVIVDLDQNQFRGESSLLTVIPKKGDRVFFDSWLAAKYPRTDGNQGDYYWLVKWEDIRAIEKISE